MKINSAFAALILTIVGASIIGMLLPTAIAQQPSTPGPYQVTQCPVGQNGVVSITICSTSTGQVWNLVTSNNNWADLGIPHLQNKH